MVSALRENTGADYSHYVDIYNNLDYYNENWPLEIGFYYLNKLYMLFGLHHQFIFCDYGCYSMFISISMFN
ncbi:EpsG family protein [Haemophilus parainfluenzae]|nr:EpsG family protein [Haemophilus parainfluenzae]